MNQQEMADLLEIQQLAARYMSMSARKDQDGWQEIFTPDGVYNAFGTPYGLDDFPMLLKSAPPGQYVGNVPVVELQGDAATGVQHYVFIDQISHDMRLGWYTTSTCALPRAGGSAAARRRSCAAAAASTTGRHMTPRATSRARRSSRRRRLSSDRDAPWQGGTTWPKSRVTGASTRASTRASRIPRARSPTRSKATSASRDDLLAETNTPEAVASREQITAMFDLLDDENIAPEGRPRRRDRRDHVGARRQHDQAAGDPAGRRRSRCRACTTSTAAAWQTCRASTACTAPGGASSRARASQSRWSTSATAWCRRRRPRSRRSRPV